MSGDRSSPLVGAVFGLVSWVNKNVTNARVAVVPGGLSVIVSWGTAAPLDAPLVSARPAT